MSEEELSSDEKTMAMVAHLGSVIGGVLLPAVIWLMKKDESEFVAYHAVQAMIYQGIALFTAVFLVVITFGLCFPAPMLVMVGGIIFALKANKGEWAGYPLIEGIGKPEGR